MIQTEIENNLIDSMELLHLEVENESPNHNVEPGSESHFKAVSYTHLTLPTKA